MALASVVDASITRRGISFCKDRRARRLSTVTIAVSTGTIFGTSSPKVHACGSSLSSGKFGWAIVPRSPLSADQYVRWRNKGSGQITFPNGLGIDNRHGAANLQVAQRTEEPFATARRQHRPGDIEGSRKTTFRDAEFTKVDRQRKREPRKAQ